VEWAFVWMMLVLKIPVILLLWLVWWAIHETDAPAPADGDDGGTKHPPEPRRPQFPFHPRRGPHGDPPPPAPARTRVTVARGRQVSRD